MSEALVAELRRLSQLTSSETVGPYVRARCREAADAIERLTAENAALRELVKELAGDLEDAIEGHYKGLLDHPAMKERYDRDMVNVVRAREAIRARKP